MEVTGQDLWARLGYTNPAAKSAPLRAHDQKKTLSQLFIDGGLTAVEKQIDDVVAAKCSERFEKKDKECDARVDRATFKINELQDKLNFERVNSGAMSCIMRIKEEKIADLEARRDALAREVDSTNAANASLHKANAELRNMQSLAQRYGSELTAADRKLEAIQKVIDRAKQKEQRFTTIDTLESILGGKTIG